MKIETKSLQTLLEKIPALTNLEKTSLLFFHERCVWNVTQKMIARVPLEFPFPSGFAVNAETFFDFVSKIKEKTLSVELIDDQLVFKGRAFVAGIVLEKTDRVYTKLLSTLPDIARMRWTKLPKSFHDGFAFVSRAASTIPNSPLSFVRVTKTQMIACNNFEVASFQIDGLGDWPLIPVAMTEIILGIVPIEASVQNNWLCFSNSGETRLFCLTGAAKYPDVPQLLGGRGKEIDVPEKIVGVVGRACLFASNEGDGEKEIKIVASGSQLFVQSRNTSGWFKEQIPLVVKTPFSFVVNPVHLLNLLAITKTIELTKNMIIFRSSNSFYGVSIDKKQNE